MNISYKKLPRARGDIWAKIGDGGAGGKGSSIGIDCKWTPSTQGHGVIYGNRYGHRLGMATHWARCELWAEINDGDSMGKA